MSRYAPVSHQPPAEFNSEDFQTMSTAYPGYSNSSENVPLKSNVTENWNRVDSEQGDRFNSSKDNLLQISDK